MKTLHISIITIMGICFASHANAYACIYCPAISSPVLVQSQQEIPAIVWEILVIGGVICSWIAIFTLFKEKI